MRRVASVLPPVARRAPARLRAGSFAVVPVAAAIDPGVAGALRVLVMIASHTDRATRSTFVSTARLARELGLSRRTVQDHVAMLLARGHIAEIPEPRRRRRSRTLVVLYGAAPPHA